MEQYQDDNLWKALN